MFGKWYQIYVKGSHFDANTGQAMKRVDDTLTSRFPAAFVAPDGIPIPSADGTYEVRCFDERMLDMVKRVLVDHHGLAIVREVENG